MRRKNSIWVLFMAGLMAGAMACGDDEPSNGNGTGNGGNDAGNGAIDTGNGDDPDTGNGTDPDAGPTDTGNGDPDTGPTDTGGGDPDTGPGDTGPPMLASEGEECTPSTNETSTELMQDDCQPDLRCVPWADFQIEALGDNTPSAITSGSLSSCIRPCEQDSDCGTGRFCALSVLRGSSLEQPVGMCVDELAGVDEACGASKLQRELIRDEDGQLVDRIKDDPSVMVGCEEGLLCQHAIRSILGLRGLQGAPTHSDEGFCQATCAQDTDCTHPDTPVCLDGLFNTGAGFCGFDSQKVHGSYCGEVDPGDKVMRIASSCGFGFDLDLTCEVDLFQQETPNGNLSICLQLCSQGDQSCASLDGEGLGQAECVLVANNPNVGLCSSNCRSLLLGNDLVCPDESFCNVTNFNLGRPDADPIFRCQDRLEPALVATEFDEFGNSRMPLGDDCSAGFDPFRCPAAHTCRDSGGGNPAAICAPLCDLRSTTADDACVDVLGAGAVCAATTSTITGTCGTPAP